MFPLLVLAFVLRPVSLSCVSSLFESLPGYIEPSRSYPSRFRIPTRSHSSFRALLLVHIKYHAFSSIFEYQDPLLISIARFQATEHISEPIARVFSHFQLLGPVFEYFRAFFARSKASTHIFIKLQPSQISTTHFQLQLQCQLPQPKNVLANEQTNLHGLNLWMNLLF